MISLTPNIFVKDMQATMDFYLLLGFEITMSVPDEPPFIWMNMKKGKVNIMFQSFESLGNELPEISRKGGGSLLIYLQMKGIRELYEKLEGKVKILKGLDKTFYGATEFSILDVNGYVLTFAEDE